MKSAVLLLLVAILITLLQTESVLENIRTIVSEQRDTLNCIQTPTDRACL